MLDPIALLQSLTLPAGAITGQRIVLDGVNGVIQIFDAAGVLKLQLSPNNQDGESALDAFDNAGNRIDKVSQSGFVNYDVAGTARVRIGNAQFTVSDAAANARIILSNTFLMVQDATGTEVFSVDTTTGDAKVAQKSLPRGLMVAPAKITSNFASGGTAEADVTGLSVTWTAISSRRYRLVTHSRGVALATTAGRARISITDSSNNHVAESDVECNNPGIVSGPGDVSEELTGLSGSQTYKVRVSTLAGGNWTLAGTPEAYLTVEDIGAV